MAAHYTLSLEFEDNDVIIDHLLSDLDEKTFADAIGFLTCDSQIEYESLVEDLGKRLPFPIVGGTTLSFPTQGKEERSAELLVLEKKGLCHSVAISEALNLSDSIAQVDALFRDCVSRMEGELKCFLVYFPLSHVSDCECYMAELFRQAGGIPVFGGINSYDMKNGGSALFAGGKAWTDRMVLIALGGSIQPVFAVGNQLTLMSKKTTAVTSASGSTVYRLDNQTVCGYLSSIGFDTRTQSGIDAMTRFGPLPIQVFRDDREDDGVPEIRCITSINAEEGSACFSGWIPEGAHLRIGILQKKDIAQSTEACLESLFHRMEEQEAKGYEYSAIFAVSCVARYFALSGDDVFENGVLGSRIPQRLAITGYYGFNEICPTQNAAGEYRNRSHSESIVICAI